MSAQNESETVDRILNNVRMRSDGDGVESHAQWCSRWQKYGKDRIYFNDTDRNSWDGYVDLEDGGVKGDTPIDTVEVENGRVHYKTEQGKTIVSRPL